MDTALAYKVGARGLRTICEAIMMDAMYEAPSDTRKTLTITRAYAERKVKKFGSKLQ